MPRHIFYLLNLSSNTILESAETQKELEARVVHLPTRYVYVICQGLLWYQSDVG